MVQRFGGQSASLLEGALDQTRKTMTTAENLFSADAVLYNELQNTLEELSEAARSVRLLADYLERHPDALIRGKGEE